jgi:hypothetical protein
MSIAPVHCAEAKRTFKDRALGYEPIRLCPLELLFTHLDGPDIIHVNIKVLRQTVSQLNHTFQPTVSWEVTGIINIHPMT